jgi:hypothetical protein
MAYTNVYTFADDNIINNIDFNNMTGGYENIYDMIRNSIYIDETHSKSLYNPDERVKTCKTSSEPKLRCDSAKLLKYLIRMELNNYKTAKKAVNKKNPKEIIKKEDYLRIIKPYTVRSSQGSQLSKEIFEDERTRLIGDTTECKRQEEISIAKCSKITNKLAKKICTDNIIRDKKICEENIRRRQPTFFKDSKLKKVERDIKDIDKIFIVNVEYLKSFFKTIRMNIQKLVDLLNGCPFLVNVDQDAITKGLMKVLYQETLKDLESKPNKTETDLITIKNIREKLETIDDKKKRGVVVRAATAVAESAVKYEDKIVTAGTTAGLGFLWYIGIVVLAGANPVMAPIMLGMLAIVGAVWGSFKLYQRLKFGAKVISKKDFIKNLSMFALNETTEIDQNINPFGEISVLRSLENDLIEYLRATGCKDPINNSNICLINVNKLCVTSVDRDCPADNDTVVIKNKTTGEYERKSIADGSKGTSRVNVFASAERKAFQKEIDKKKQLTKGILKRMGKMFDAFGEAAEKETLPYVDLLADGEGVEASDTDY